MVLVLPTPPVFNVPRRGTAGPAGAVFLWGEINVEISTV